MRAPAPVGADLLEARMQATFGMGLREYDDSAVGRVPTAYLSEAIRIVDRSGVLPELKKWDALRRKSSAGRKAVIPLDAVLVLLLLNVRMGYGVTYLDMSKTLDRRFGLREFERLGIQNINSDGENWYKLIWQATQRMLALIDPYPAPRNSNMLPEAFARHREEAATENAVTDSREKLERINWLCKRLLVVSVEMLPRDIWEKYRGTTIIDATKLQIAGAPNATDPTVKRRNPDCHSGRYMREGSHGGQGKKTDVAAYELETAIMGWNHPGENTTFPSLITAVTFHRPGELIGHGAHLVKTVQDEYGFERILVIADRAYNGGTIETFHIPLREMGAELVIDYKSNDVSVQGHYEDLVLLDGNWHVNRIPERLLNATVELESLIKQVTAAKNTLYEPKIAGKRVKEPSQAQRAERAKRVAAAKKVLADADAHEAVLRVRIANRHRYAMVPKGKPDSEGYQRFLYPSLDGDLTSGAKNERKTITVPILIPEGHHSTSKNKQQPVKFLQKYTHESEIWVAYYGMRSLVEASNNLLKLASGDNIGDPKRRSGRGFAFHYIAATLAAVSSNIRRIITFFRDEANRSTDIRVRSRRRKDEHGNALARHQQLLVAPQASP
jgi:hypothetical protein